MSALTNTVVAAMDVSSAMFPGTLCQNFNFTLPERRYEDEPDLQFIDQEEVVTQQPVSSENSPTTTFFKVTPSRGRGMLKYILPTTDLHDSRVGVLEHPRGTHSTVDYEKLAADLHDSRTESREHSLGARSSAMHSTAGHVQLATDLHVSQIRAREHSLGAQPLACRWKKKRRTFEKRSSSIVDTVH